MATSDPHFNPDPFAAVVAATEAVTAARRALADANVRLRDAMAAYLATPDGVDANVPTPMALPTSATTEGASQRKGRRLRGSIETRMIAMLRAAGGAEVTTASMATKLNARTDTVRGLAARLASDAASGVVRVRKGVFAFRVVAGLPAPSTSATELARSSKGGRPPSDATRRIDSVLDRVLRVGVWMPTADVVERAKRELGDVDNRQITDRLYRRSRGDNADILTRGDRMERTYSLKEKPAV